MKNFLKNNKYKIIVLVTIFILIITLIGVSIIVDIPKGNIKKDSQEEKIAQSNERDETKNQIKVITDYINIRRSNSVNSDKIGKVYKDEIYTIISEEDNSDFKWIEIETNNKIHGYISGSSDYVEKLIPTNDKEDDTENVNTTTTKDNETNKTNSNKSNSNKTTTNASSNQNANEDNKQKDTTNNDSKNTNVEKPQSEVKKCEKTCDEGYTLKNSDTSSCYCEKNLVETEEDNDEKEKLKEEYLVEVENENNRFKEVKEKTEENYYYYSLYAKDNMEDQEYFASFYGGLYYGTERQYNKECEKLRKNNEYEKLSKLNSRWYHTQQYREWKDYYDGLPEEKRLYIKKLTEEHEANLKKLKQKYNQ